MKNSLFKRACAAAVAVPVALAQCLTIANAVEVTEAPTATEQALTAKSLVSIPAEDGYKLVEENTYEKYSDWNIQLAGYISQIKSGSIDPSKVIDAAVKKSGKYSELAEAVADKIGAIKYTKDDLGNITVIAELEDANPAFEELAQKYVDDAVKGMVIEYDEQKKALEEIKNTKFFDGIVVAGKIKVVLSTADLALGTTVTAEYSVIDENGVEYKGVAAVKFVESKIEALKASADATIKDFVDNYEISEEELDQKIRDSKEFKDMIEEYSGTITLTGEEITAAARASEDYKNKVAELVEAGMTEAEAKEAIEDSDDFKELIDKYSEVDITLTPEEVEAAVLKSDDYAAKAKEVKAEYAEKVADMKAKLASAQVSFNNTVDQVTVKIDSAKNYLEKAKGFRKSNTFEDSAAILKYIDKNKNDARVPAFLKNRVNNVPASFEAAASTNIVTKIFAEIINQAASKSPVALDFSAAQVGAFVDKFEDIETNVDKLDATITATYADADAAAVKDYFVANYDAAEVSSWMEVEAEADMTAAEAGVAKVDFKLKRVVTIVEAEKTTTTTTATTTTTTDATTTTTTTTDAESTTTTTTTTGVESTTTTTTTDVESTTTTTTTTDAESTTTTTTTTGAESTTTTTTTTDAESTTTTTTTTDAESTTTTTTTTEPEVTTTTATKVVIEKEYNCTAVAGFYLNTDAEYDKAQVSAASVTIQRQLLTVGEDGKVISAENDGAAETIDLMGKFEFAAKPSDEVTADVMTARKVALVASEDIKDSKGNVIVAKGDEIGEVVIEAYVGVKGDINLDGAADSKDASRVLAVYADLSTGANKAEYKYSNSEIVPGASSVLDDFAAFLADVNNETAANNHLTAKTQRALDSNDASKILAFYSEASTAGSTADRRAIWDKVLAK